MERRNIHGFEQHSSCPDINCCDCECRTCKRAWFAAGRPSPADCPDHRRDADDPAALRREALSVTDRRKGKSTP